MKTIALQVKTNYSILESLNNISKLICRAKELGYTSLAITDNNNLFGAIEFYSECKKNDIKPLIGVELNYNNTNILLYAINNNGYKKLIKIVTEISDDTFNFNNINEENDLLLIMPFSSFNKEIFNKFKYKYIGYNSLEERKKVPGEFKCVFINDVSYLYKEDYKYLDYLYMIKEGKTLGEFELGTFINKHLMTNEEILNSSLTTDLENSIEISNMCNVEIKYTKGLLPVYDENIDSKEYLKTLCNKGLKKRLNNEVTNLYQTRLDYELDTINKMGFNDYFLVVWDYVKYAKFHNILVGPGRGSAAGSLVSYTLGITDVDPIKYDLLFERFLNPERVTMPDIDIDFDNEKIDEVINYVINKYGNKKVAGIITFMTIGAKQAIRDVGRILKINNNIIDNISKSIKQDTLEENYEKNSSFKRLIKSNIEYEKMYNIATKIEGLVRNPSMHAAGIVMSKYSIDETIPLYKNDSGIYLTAFTKDYLESLGLLKMDFLRLATLGFIDEVINNIRENEKLNITFEKIPLNDKKTLKIFYDVKTDGIFQFESPGMKNFLSKLKVSSFDDIVASLALFRPGPMDNIDLYIRRKNHLENIDYIHPTLEPILKNTYGIIIYQEQIMQIASVMAGFTYGEADLLRRAMSKKDETKLKDARPKFINGSLNKGYDLKTANYVFDLILKFADYGFNKSHSVAYAIISYKMAFLKTYFLKYFIVSSLTNVIGNEIKTKKYIVEARTNNIKILPPDINDSKEKYVYVTNGILCPLTIIKNVGRACYLDIIKERSNGKFLSFIDFVKRCYSKSINTKVITSLVQAGCFDNFEYNKKTIINNLDKIINYCELNNDSGILSIEEPLIDIYDEYSNDELLSQELSVYGFYLKNHPVLKYKTDTDIDLINISDYFNKIVYVTVMVDRLKEIATKKNDIMCFIDGSDDTSSINITVFPKLYSENNNYSKNNILRIKGSVEKRMDKYQIIAYEINLLN